MYELGAINTRQKGRVRDRVARALAGQSEL
jgi:hypothetical protein